jgi:hypothetical protein
MVYTKSQIKTIVEGINVIIFPGVNLMEEISAKLNIHSGERIAILPQL